MRAGWWVMNGFEDFGAQRHLIVGGKPHVVQVLRQVLGILGVKQVEAIADTTAAIEALRSRLFTSVLCDDGAAKSGKECFARAARQSSGLLNPMIPIFLVSGGPRRRDVEAARDRGFTDVLTRPISAATLMRKLKTALAAPRPFIASSDFFGPDRRSPQRPNFGGKDRRTRKARQVKVGAPPSSSGEKVLI
jgi:two-component system chemotaxis response regulator CheY